MTVIFYKLSIVGVVLVLLAACSATGDIPVEKPGPFEVCKPEPGSPFSYRKVILVAGTIGVPDLARDLPGLASLTSKRVQTHLDALERFNVLATHNTSFDSTALDTDARVRRIGRQYASQFVVKLELQDLTIQSSGGWLSKLFGGIIQHKALINFFGGKAQRNVLIKLYIYDTEYGALFHSQQYQRSVSGNVIGYPGNGVAVTSSWFSTDLGSQIDQILKTMSMQINEKLACVPFSTEVASVKGNDIHINAGFLHGIRPGGTLRVYRRSDILATDGAQKQGKDKGWITVNTVFPNRSIASVTQDELDGDRLNAGDVVRAW